MKILGGEKNEGGIKTMNESNVKLKNEEHCNANLVFLL